MAAGVWLQNLLGTPGICDLPLAWAGCRDDGRGTSWTSATCPWASWLPSSIYVLTPPHLFKLVDIWMKTICLAFLMPIAHHISTMDFCGVGRPGRVLFKKLSCSKQHIRFEEWGSPIDDVSKSEKYKMKTDKVNILDSLSIYLSSNLSSVYK